MIKKLARRFNKSQTKYLVAFKWEPSEMIERFNVDHLESITVDLEKDGNESVGSEYTTMVHFYERKEMKEQQGSTIEKNFQPIVDIASNRNYENWIKLTTDGNVVKSIKEAGN